MPPAMHADVRCIDDVIAFFFQAVGRNGVFQMMNIAKRSMKSSAFAKMATSTKYEPPVEFKGDPARLEMHYWKNMGYARPYR